MGTLITGCRLGWIPHANAQSLMGKHVCRSTHKKNIGIIIGITPADSEDTNLYMSIYVSEVRVLWLTGKAKGTSDIVKTYMLRDIDKYRGKVNEEAKELNDLYLEAEEKFKTYPEIQYLREKSGDMA